MSDYTFTDSDAEIILVCLSGRKFHVHKCILSLASSVFKGMFSLPQPPPPSEKAVEITPGIPVSEAEQALETLLRFIYPVPNPIIASLDELIPVLEAAVKYDVQCALVPLRKMLVSPEFLDKEPIRIFAIACRYEFEPETTIASKHTVKTHILGQPFLEEFRHISAYSYHMVLELHNTLSKDVAGLLADLFKLGPGCSNCSRYGAQFNWNAYVLKLQEEMKKSPYPAHALTLEYLTTVSWTSCSSCSSKNAEAFSKIVGAKKKIEDLLRTP